MCFRKESENTVSTQEPKRGSDRWSERWSERGGATPPGDAFGSRPRNWLVPMMLLSIRQRESYGYELMERARALGFGATNPGTLYRTLRRMEEDGVVESSRETTRGGPARRVYAITDAGEAHLGFWAESLGRYRRTMDAFFRPYAGRPPRTEPTEDPDGEILAAHPTEAGERGLDS